LSYVVLDEGLVVSNHIFSDTSIGEFLIEGSPFWRGLIIVVENMRCSSDTLLTDGCGVQFTARTWCPHFRFLL
jgi:hypothetical protein